MQSICLIIPCYNESERLQKASIVEALATYSKLHLCFVNDGSNDDTTLSLVEMLKELPDDLKLRCWVVSYLKNKGKSGAIQQGLLAMIKRSILPFTEIQTFELKGDDFQIGSSDVPDFEYFGYWDADLATPFNELEWFFYHAQSGQYLLMMGSRVARLGAEIHRTIFRHYSGRLFATAISQGLGWKVHDTQCGAKIFKREVLEVIVSGPFVTQWLFDVEILLRMKKKWGESVRNQILEVPLRKWEDVKGSKIGIKDFVKVPFQIWKVFRSY